ncbi:MAG TPA: hypothetical protein PK631_06095, partial [Erysipelotrichaceae bacterium]|nr:hypothetical protein [Erysipelotrichaceae bacterium]
MKRKKIGLLLAVLVVISALSIYLSWYQVEIYAPPSSIYGDKYNYRLSYSEAKKYLEFFNNATFYDMAFPESGEITDEDNHFFRIEISVGFKKQTYYFHHYINMIYKYAEDGHSRECYYYDWFSDFFIYHLELDRKYNGLIQQ